MIIKQDAEANLLGAIIVAPDTLGTFRDKVTEAHFGYIPHKTIWLKLVFMFDNRVKIDLITLKESFNAEQLANVGGPSYLAALVSNLPSSPSTDTYYRICADAYQRRVYQEKAGDLITAADKSEDIETCHVLADSIRAQLAGKSVPDIGTASQEAITRLARQRTEGIDLKFGISGLDELFGGIRRRQITTIGGKTSHCKTTVIRNVALNVLDANPRAKVLINGFENIEDMPLALASIHSGIPLDHFVKPHLISDDQMDAVVLALDSLDKYKDRLMLAGGESVARTRQLVREFRPDILVLDYVQRCAEKFSGGKEEERRHSVAKITSDLQDLAIEFNLHCFNLSQIRRISEMRGSKEPEINDLKESGDIENYSDNIILLYWPWRDSMDETVHRKSQYKFLIRKNKTGPCTNIEAYINLETLKIT